MSAGIQLQLFGVASSSFGSVRAMALAVV